MLVRGVSLPVGMVLVVALLLALVVGAVVVVFFMEEKNAVRPGAVALIDGIAISELEWHGMRVQAELSLELMREQVELGDEHPGGPAISAMFACHLELAEAHGVDVHVIGQLVILRATEAEALRRGYEATDEEVAESMRQQRKLHEQVMTGAVAHPDAAGDEVIDEGTGESRAMIEAIHAALGEERYWEMIEEWQRRNVAVGKYVVEYLRLQPAQADPPEPWRRHQVRLARAASIELGPELHGLVSVEDLRRYLDDVEAMEAELAAAHHD